MTDPQLDTLISQALERRHMLDDLNADIMLAVRRAEARARLHLIVRTLAFSFGLPLLMLFYAWGIYFCLTHVRPSLALYASLGVSIMAMTVVIVRMIATFSPRDCNNPTSPLSFK